MIITNLSFGPEKYYQMKKSIDLMVGKYKEYSGKKKEDVSNFH